MTPVARVSGPPVPPTGFTAPRPTRTLSFAMIPFAALLLALVLLTSYDTADTSR
ncbi:MAG TPA: hypothetical protein VHE13_08670 [Opitutus sp.]|nr:hypothetical protein [Opitutus sp.]